MLGELAVDYARRRITVAGQAVELTVTEYELRRALSLGAGRVVTHEMLLSRVWNDRENADANLVRIFRPQPAAQARRRRCRSHLHLQRPRRRLPHVGNGGNRHRLTPLPAARQDSSHHFIPTLRAFPSSTVKTELPWKMSRLGRSNTVRPGHASLHTRSQQVGDTHVEVARAVHLVGLGRELVDGCRIASAAYCHQLADLTHFFTVCPVAMLTRLLVRRREREHHGGAICDLQMRVGRRFGRARCPSGQLESVEVARIVFNRKRITLSAVRGAFCGS